jgi:hypothetical protein
MIKRALAAPFHAAQLLTGAKSFVDNPLIGSAWLNRHGLHVGRMRLAERMAESRRRRLRHLVDPADADTFACDGIVIRHEVLPPERFARLRDALADRRLPAHEMRQGGTVTRFVTLNPALLGSLPELDAVARGPLLQGLMRYVAATDADPLLYLNAVFATPETASHDPQTVLHSDTFHAAAKAWFFLEDVGPDDGPFTYVPGSHRLTPGRAAWERAQSIAARNHPVRVHARGSLRATVEEIGDMGYAPPTICTVPANTLVVADTHGFHARGRPSAAAARPALYASLRRNPFLPWTGLDVASLPGLRWRKAQAWDGIRATAARHFERPDGQPHVGDRRLLDWPEGFDGLRDDG